MMIYVHVGGHVPTLFFKSFCYMIVKNSKKLLKIYISTNSSTELGQLGDDLNIQFLNMHVFSVHGISATFL